jgi:membrane-anchored protein YejM (alkaline phosphatase superfamily)
MKLKVFEINYIYFGILFLSLLGVHGYSFMLLQNVEAFPFFGSVLLQCFLEAWVLLFLSLLIQKYAHKTFFYSFVILSCFLILAHQVDFIMIRLMGVTIWYLLNLVYAEMGDNFTEMIKATNIPFGYWMLGVFSIFVFFAIAVLFFHYTEKLAKKKKLRISLKTLTLFFVLPLILMIIWDKTISKKISYKKFEQLCQILPFKNMVFSPKHEVISNLHSLKKIERSLEPISLYQERKPPIYIFVIESLREDFITNEIAPNISRFRDENVFFDVAASGGNASHFSWFTIFHSQFPLRFSKEYVQKTIKEGSRAISLMKDIGYKIHLYSSAELAFYHMGESIFGKDYRLADTFFEFPHEGKVTADQSDREVMKELIKDQDEFHGDGHLFIVFLDATHFGYSWPREGGDRFSPTEEPINYIKAAYTSASVEKIKNRYRNAIYYVDSLIGDFLKGHKQDDAVILVTGDHGEAFYEEGHIFHASNLSQSQIHIPLYYKFGKESEKMKEKASKISSHIDIFPTLIDYVKNEDATFFGLEGESIFKQDRWPYTLTARYNGGKEPFEFCLQNLDGKMILQRKKGKPLKVASLSSSENAQFLKNAELAITHVYNSN